MHPYDGVRVFSIDYALGPKQTLDVPSWETRRGGIRGSFPLIRNHWAGHWKLEAGGHF